MKHWTELDEKATSPSVDDKDVAQQTYVLRPLWQRLLLSGGLVVGGVLAGGLIMASRDRTVWRMRLSRLSAPNVRRAMPVHEAPVVLTLETASGRSKNYMLKNCELAPGRDATEMLLRIQGIRGGFLVNLPRSVILGEKEDDFARNSAASLTKENFKTAKKKHVSRTSNYMMSRSVVKGALEDDIYDRFLSMNGRLLNAWLSSGGMSSFKV